MDTINIVDAAIAQDKEAFMAAFNAAIMPKIGDAIEVKKVEIASSLLTPEEATNNEIPEFEAEVDGSDAGSATAEQSTDAEATA